MTVAQISQAIQDVPFLTYIRESGYTYPVIMATHLACIAAFGGLILLTDLRLLGWALTDCTISDVVKSLRPWKWLGFCIMVTCGLLLGLSESNKYYGNPYFQIKMLMLAMVGVHAIVFRPSVYKNTEALDAVAPKIPAVAKRAAAFSLIIWISIACLGRWIAYYEPPKSNGQPISLNNPASPLTASVRR
ncbi:MAG TPA: DUF6644 family protein [Bryobacteraceae bacterium]|nr:DUF6644 family protein [Bryobacteraceae bacterium]